VNILDLDTPAVVIDLDIVDQNIARAQALLESLGIALRPHIKTHKLPRIAAMQVAAGAKGIACQKLSEAEAFADAGFGDILLCYNIMGREKLRRLRALAERAEVKVVADSEAVVDGLSKAFAGSGRDLPVLVECDTGMHRCGVESPAAAVALSGAIERAPGLCFAGLMTYPAPGMHDAVQAFLSDARTRITASGASCWIVSNGGTPSLAEAGLAPVATEYRPGTYVYNDRSLVARGACAVEDCALHVVTRVVSRPAGDRAIVDAGSKSLTSDLLGLSGYGIVADYPGAVVAGLSEEHGHVDLSAARSRPALGEVVRILPNHACPVTNLFDRVWLHRSGRIVEEARVVARGGVT
jgi:D-serine deaminase-like pyridoxal phosphate-dependent protein